jgi:hypothetical protein
MTLKIVTGLTLIFNEIPASLEIKDYTNHKGMHFYAIMEFILGQEKIDIKFYGLCTFIAMT